MSTLAARRRVKAKKFGYNQPGRADVHVNRPLTNVSVAFMQETEGFVAGRAAPIVPVEFQSDRYFVYLRDEFNRHEMRVRAPGTESAGSGYRIDNTPNYFCPEYGYHKDIPDTIRANADDPLNMDREATEFVSLKALINREKVWATTFFKTGVWATEWTGATVAAATSFVYFNRTASTPIENIRAWRTAVKLKGGLRPNKIIMGTHVWNALMDHPDIIGRIDRGQTSGPAIANREAMAALFEVDEILVMDAIENTAIEGATESNAFIGGKHLLLTYVTKRPGLMTPTSMYTFEWRNSPAKGISKLRAPLIKSDRVEIEDCFDNKLISSDLGFMALNAVE